MGWVATYPYAGEMVTLYSNALADLSLYKSNIENNINGIKIDASIYEDFLLEGDYYDVYTNKVALWNGDAKMIVTEMNNFLVVLNARINDVRSKISLWQSRKTMRVWVK